MTTHPQRRFKPTTDASKEVGLEVNTEKQAYVDVSSSNLNIHKVSYMTLEECGQVQIFGNAGNWG
jgi:hypothetical protein